MPHNNSSHRHNRYRKVQDIDDPVGIICCCTQITYSQSAFFCSNTAILCGKQCINGRRYKRKEIVITRLCFAVAAPFVEPVEIGTKGEDQWSLLYHILSEVYLPELFFQNRVFSNHYA